MVAREREPSRNDAPEVEPPISRPRENCWCAPRAERFAVLVDADEYFRRLVQVLERARQSIFILGWDVDSRLPLPTPGEGCVSLAELLDRLARASPRLRIHVLSWDFAAIFALEREKGTIERLGRRTHRHVRFRFDSKHPLGASHHQKIVVVDDTVAFVGGLDLTTRRWDTCAHRCDEPRRVDLAGAPYRPFHDVQSAVAGAPAEALGQLARARWKRVSRRRTPPLSPRPVSELWPEDLPADVVGARVAIARTVPAFARQPAIHEVRDLLLDSIAAARRSIYAENQYFTSPLVAEALARRLAEPDGPEIVLVLPRLCEGWLERRTIGVMRDSAVRTVLEADVHGHLRLLYPMASREKNQLVFVHSKVICIDDRWLRVGSSNFSNRSMGLDTECDLAVEASAPEHRAGIVSVRNRLLAEHLGATPEQVERELQRGGSLAAVIDALAHGDRAPLAPEDFDTNPSDLPLYYEFGVDPERPMAVSRFIDRFLSEVRDPGRKKRRRTLLLGASGALLLIGLAAAWHFTPLRQYLDVERLRAVATGWIDRPWAPLAVIGAYVVGELLVLPHNALVVITVLVFGVWRGALWAVVGSMAGHLTGFGVGRLMGGRIVTHLPQSSVSRLAAKLGRSNVLTVMLLRILPIAPSSLVDVVCGAARVRLWPFLAGTLLAKLPALILLAIFGEQLDRVLREGSVVALLVLLAIVGAAMLGAWWIRRRVAAHELANQDAEGKDRTGGAGGATVATGGVSGARAATPAGLPGERAATGSLPG